VCVAVCFFLHATASSVLYTLSLHDALPIFDLWLRVDPVRALDARVSAENPFSCGFGCDLDDRARAASQPGEFGHRPERSGAVLRSEEHTSELQSLRHLVCRLLLEKKNKTTQSPLTITRRYDARQLPPADLSGGQYDSG